MSRAEAAERQGLRAAPWWLWFGVVGAGVAWSVHLLVAWGLDETVCRSGHDEVLGLGLTPLLAVVTAVMLVVALASTVVAWRLRRSLSSAEPAEGASAVRQLRAVFMATVGAVMGLLFSAMIVMGEIAVLVFPPC